MFNSIHLARPWERASCDFYGIEPQIFGLGELDRLGAVAKLTERANVLILTAEQVPSTESRERSSVMAIHGFTNPLSPTGRASAVEPPPHFISADAIRVVFRAGEEVVRQYLPEGLEPVDGGLGFAYVADMMKVSASEPDQAYLNPERTQYGEGIIGFYCKHGETRGRFSAFIWVDQDWSMQFGVVMGWAKKMAEVHRTRINPFNPAMEPIGPGTKLKGVVHRHGRTLFELGVEIEKEEASTPLEDKALHGEKAFLLRYFPSVGPAIPETKQLLGLPLTDGRTGDMFSGKPYLKFGASDNEDLEPLKNVELVRGYTYKSGWKTDTVLEVLHDYTESGGW